MKPGFFTISETAAILKVHPNTLRRWEKEKKLIPRRDRITGYRYYSQEQIRNYLLRGSTPLIEVRWGYDQSVKARKEEVTKVKKSLDVLVSSQVSTSEPAIDQELLILLEEAVLRGARVRFIRNLNNPQMKARAKKMKKFGVKTKSRQLFNVTLSIRDKQVVRLEVPSDNPEQRFNLLIHDSKVADSFSIFFEKLWEKD
jgi:hypothetical protein